MTAEDAFSGRDFSPANASTRLRDPVTCPSPSQANADTTTTASERAVIIRTLGVDFTGRAYLHDSVEGL